MRPCIQGRACRAWLRSSGHSGPPGTAPAGFPVSSGTPTRSAAHLAQRPSTLLVGARNPPVRPEQLPAPATPSPGAAEDESVDVESWLAALCEKYSLPAPWMTCDAETG